MFASLNSAPFVILFLFTDAHQAAIAFHQALGKVAKMASLSKGPANTLSELILLNY